MGFEHDVEIEGIFIAAEHRIFNKKGRTEGYDNVVELELADLRAGSGIVGDRFFADRPDFNGHVTFFSFEVYQELVRSVGSTRIGPEGTRRNIIISGVDLKLLYGQRFKIGEIEFEGTIHCAPCRGMDDVYGVGALKTLKGRGGLRARILSSGTIEKGTATMSTEFEMDFSNIANPDVFPRLP